MIEVNDVIEFHGLKPKHFQLAVDDDTKLEAIVEKWITQAEDLIVKFTHNPALKEDTPAGVENICLRLVSNMINLAITRRDTPIIKVNDWTVQSTSSRVFSNDLKEDLKPYCIEHSEISDQIDIFAITGRD